MRKINKAAKPALNSTSALVSVVAALMPIAAQAQDQAPADQSQQAEEDDDIVVTGTRVRSEFNSPSPIQVITTDAAAQQGVISVGQMLQNSSISAGSPQIDATISSAFVTQGGPGAETISLRGLGANRTLVLLNGRRAGPAGTRGEVGAFDLSVLPFSIVERVDILKDGASSVYGSDAEAGVVNIITRRDFDGGQANLFYSQPEEDGGQEISGDLAWGHVFSRGHITATADYYHQNETTLGSRDYTNCSVDRTFDATTGERTDLIDPRTGQPACAQNVSTGLVWLYDLSGEGQFAGDFTPNFIQYDGSGQIGTLLPQSQIPMPLSPFGPTTPTNFFWVNQPGDLDTQGVVDTNSLAEQNSSWIPENERTSFFVEGAYELNDNVEAYAEVLLNRRKTTTHGFRQVWTYLYSYDYGDPFSVGWGGAAILSPTFVTDHFGSETTVDYRRVVVGLRGDLDGRLGPVNWDLYYQDSHSDGDYGLDVILDDAVRSAEGRSVFGTSGIFGPNSLPRSGASCVGLVTPISNRPCVDVDWLSPTALSGGGFTDEEEAFLYDRDVGNTTYDQRFVEGSIGADLFTLPAGNVAGVLGLVHRYDEILDTPGAITRSGNSWNLTSAGITAGSDTTTEVFGELAIPILRDAPFAERLDVTVSGRFTDVGSYGNNETYKVGANWQLTPEFMLRATRGTSFRAPTLFELYLADQTGFLRQVDVDPCVRWGDALDAERISPTTATNCASLGIDEDYNGQGSGVTISSSGGLGHLVAETSEATVAGFVWTPRFANLSVAVDYFDIQIFNEVRQLGAGNIVTKCMSSVDFPNDPACDLFSRGIGGNQFGIAVIDDSYINVADQRNRGIDVTGRYTHDLPFGVFTAQAQITYQLEDKTSLFPGFTDDDNGRNGDPKFVGNFDFNLVRGPWTFFWGLDVVGETDDEYLPDVASIDGNQRYIISAETVYYNDASIQYDFGQFQLLAGVANIFNQEPPEITTVGAALQGFVGPSLLTSNYDYLGRRAFVRLSASF